MAIYSVLRAEILCMSTRYLPSTKSRRWSCRVSRPDDVEMPFILGNGGNSAEHLDVAWLGR